MSPLLLLTLIAAGFIAIGTVLVCASRIPGLRVLVGAEDLGPMPPAARPDWHDVLTERADRFDQQARTEPDHVRRAALRMLADGLRQEAER